jgi:N-acylneuraminate cytidylyltransferase/CMP-N,N'-diacetyllegionaminic acid synthase
MIAIIPARGGSKGLPGKNIKKLGGRPLIDYTIQAAILSNLFTNIIVSTEDPVIRDISIQCGAEVPFLRPDSIAQDQSVAIDAYLYTIDQMEKILQRDISKVAVLLPTSPLRNELDIKNAFKLFKDRDADSVISYTKEHHPISWHKYIDDLGRISSIFPENLSNRQELNTSYFPNGAIYFFKTSVLRKRKYFTENSYGYIMPRIRSVDIDVQEDFDLAEFYLNKFNGN